MRFATASVLAAFALALPFVTSAEANGINSAATSVSPSGQLVALSWPTPEVGWALASRMCGQQTCAVLSRTTNGGKTWSREESPTTRAAQYCLIGGTSCVSRITFVTPRVGYLYGPSLWMTTNAGRSWSHVRGERTETLSAVGPTVYRIAYHHTGCPGPCSPVLQVSSPGGQQWRTVLSSLKPPDRSDSAQIVAYLGKVIVASYGSQACPLAAYASVIVGAGSQWHYISDPCTRFGAAAHLEEDLTSIGGNESELVGLCTPHMGSPHPSFTVTSRDGGQNWSRGVNLPGGDLYGDIAVSPRGTLLVEASSESTSTTGVFRSEVIASFDNGQQWQQVANHRQPVTSGAAFLPQIGFTSARRGWWLVTPRVLEMSSDGGHTWSLPTVVSGPAVATQGFPTSASDFIALMKKANGDRFVASYALKDYLFFPSGKITIAQMPSPPGTKVVTNADGYSGSGRYAYVFRGTTGRIVQWIKINTNVSSCQNVLKSGNYATGTFGKLECSKPGPYIPSNGYVEEDAGFVPTYVGEQVTQYSKVVSRPPATIATKTSRRFGSLRCLTQHSGPSSQTTCIDRRGFVVSWLLREGAHYTTQVTLTSLDFHPTQRDFTTLTKPTTSAMLPPV